MLQWSLEAVLASDSFAFPLSDVWEALLPNLLELGEDVCKQLGLLLLCDCTSRLSFHLWKRVARPLHAMDSDCAGDILIQLRLPYFTEQEYLGPTLLLVRVDPEELQCSIAIEGKRQILILQGRTEVNVSLLRVQELILNFKFPPFVLNTAHLVGNFRLDRWLFGLFNGFVHLDIFRG